MDFYGSFIPPIVPMVEGLCFDRIRTNFLYVSFAHLYLVESTPLPSLMWKMISKKIQMLRTDMMDCTWSVPCGMFMVMKQKLIPSPERMDGKPTFVHDCHEDH